MNAVLEKEDLESWKAYLRWHLVNANAPYLSAAFVNADFDFFGKTLGGAQELEPRWKRCVSYTDNDLGEALGQAYVQRAFSPEAKQRAQEMVKEIEQAMERDIQSLSWMSPETKQKALEKLHAVANKIGYPDKWRDYTALTIARDDEMGNVLRARTFEFNRQLAKIGKPVDRGEWGMTPPTVNAYYNPQINDINFPAGILQPPFFDPSADDAPNYGDIGATIGHELTHGFDDEGRQFDAHGNLRDWWTPEDGKQFEQRASCVSDQYSQYVAVDDIKINGQLTMGENVADLGGLMLAYMAWQDETRGKKLDPIDGLTPEQRFFIGYGQSWCSNTRDETKRMYATIDPHSPDKYRANGVVSNSPEFQQAFQCKARFADGAGESVQSLVRELLGLQASDLGHQLEPTYAWLSLGLEQASSISHESLSYGSGPTSEVRRPRSDACSTADPPCPGCSRSGSAVPRYWPPNSAGSGGKGLDAVIPP